MLPSSISCKLYNTFLPASVSCRSIVFTRNEFAGVLLFNKMLILKFYLPALPPNYVTLPNNALSQSCLPVYVVRVLRATECCQSYKF